MTQTQLKRRLLSAAASEQEADFLAEIWYADYFLLTATKPTLTLLCELAERIGDWREERREFAAVIRADRRMRLDAGYHGTPMSAPVILNGVSF